MKADEDQMPLNNRFYDSSHVLSTNAVIVRTCVDSFSQWVDINKLGNDSMTHAHKSYPKTTPYLVNGREVGSINYTARFVSVRSTNRY